MNKELNKYWHDFCQQRGIDSNKLDEAYAFGDNVEMANQLADLVNRGIKTATTSIYDEREPVAPVGQYSIILDGSGQPVCVIQNKVVEVMPFKQVSQEHAYHEGEGNRDYETWCKEHWNFFTKECQAEGFGDFTEDTKVVCEVFTKIE
ncbi:ASCH domain-containing protein [Lactobacillus sp. ESL0684]|uniref:ASCH domain-containing protein n=1 Tax=Lactobacillus sp. ESL0684 TaxID=2983213 RepID=UPI0023F7544B|nr:ASCH domain-containing protein [Lactobacillus sp. ESL0684]WEV44302.1 ASCH domain-containing protein [Lactobacillus sp. ESL0684]